MGQEKRRTASMTALEALVLCIARQQRFGLTCREDEFSRADHAKQLDAHIQAMLAEVAERELKTKIS